MSIVSIDFCKTELRLFTIDDKLVPDLLLDLESVETSSQLGTLLIRCQPIVEDFLFVHSLVLRAQLMLQYVQSLRESDPLVKSLLLRALLNKIKLETDSLDTLSKKMPGLLLLYPELRVLLIC